MHIGKLVFLRSLTLYRCMRFVEALRGTTVTATRRHFPVSSNYLRMTFAQLTHHESLRDIEICLHTQKDKLYHRGIRGNVSRST